MLNLPYPMLACLWHLRIMPHFPLLFSTSAALEIYSLNLTEPGLDMGLVGTLNSEHRWASATHSPLQNMKLCWSVPNDGLNLSLLRFHKVAWGCHGISEGDLPSGVLVGGADAGNLLVYDPAKLIKGEDALICQKDKHTGPVYALDFNTFQVSQSIRGTMLQEVKSTKLRQEFQRKLHFSATKRLLHFQILKGAAIKLSLSLTLRL